MVGLEMQNIIQQLAIQATIYYSQNNRINNIKILSWQKFLCTTLVTVGIII